MKQKHRKVTEFKSVEAFEEYLKSEHFEIGLANEIPPNGRSALAQTVTCYNRKLGNRWAILPMEGWDCLADGSPSEFTRRRWLQFASSGAKLLYGTEAAAVMHTGRSNPRQLMISHKTAGAIEAILKEMRRTHRECFGTDDDLCIGLQLTHSGRFSHPNEWDKLEPRTAYAHQLLDKKFHCSAADVVSDEEVYDIIEKFVSAAKLAQEIGFDFVDVKHAHGYLGHEFLSAVDRPGPFGGTFENRTRFFRLIAEGIQRCAPGLGISSRVSLFDIFPYEKGPDGVGAPMAWPERKFYPYAFGGDGTGMGADFGETVKFLKLLKSFGGELVCATIGSPYYNVHMQRPAYYPVCDGYDMPEHPLYNVARHLHAVRTVKKLCPELKFVGSGYTCLQEYLPNAAEYAVAHMETDFVGIGRMVLSYPRMCADVLEGKKLDVRSICRTFGDCTNAPRHGMISGCYPLNSFYKLLPEALRVKELKGIKKP
ncbi:MAG: hypothetical protein PHI35_01905 [Victivallaceae bacterium]|nr:hypothetical protein [Victivallaceae bacterium]